MESGGFFKDNRTIIIIVVIIVIVLLVYYFFFSGNSNTVIVRPRVTVARENKFDSCMTPELQEKIATKISNKINEMQSCDCDDVEMDLTQSDMELESDTANDNTAQLRSNIREAFKRS